MLMESYIYKNYPVSLYKFNAGMYCENYLYFGGITIDGKVVCTIQNYATLESLKSDIIKIIDQIQK